MTQVARLGLGPVASIGVRAALERGTGRSPVPARSMLAAVSLGVGALVGALVFGANLARMVSSPTRWGWGWDRLVEVSLTAEGPKAETQVQARRLEHDLERAGFVDAVSRFRFGRLTVDGRSVQAVGASELRGHLGLTAITGRLPERPGEIALGTRTLSALHRHVGDSVAVSRLRGGISRMRIVGSAAFPDISQYAGADNLELGSGALVDEHDLASHSTTYDPSDYALVVGLGHPATDQALLDRLMQPERTRFLAGEWEQERTPQRPDDIVGLSLVRQVPEVLSAVLAALALALLAHVIAVSQRARRRELAVLKALGFVRRDLVSSTAWQASTVAVIASALALVGGTVAGRLAWSATARQIGVVADATTPVVPLLLVAVGALLAANLVALGPALAAARTSVTRSLRAE